MSRLVKAVFKATAIVILSSLPYAAASAQMGAMRGLPVDSLTAESGLVHKTGMRPIAGAYRSSRPAGSGSISGQHGHGHHRGAHNRHHGGNWFTGDSWFGHHGWFNARPKRQSVGSIKPATAQAATSSGPASTGKPAPAARSGAIAGNNPRAGVTLQDKAYRALIRATYPVALKHKPLVRHVNRHAKRPRKIVAQSATHSHVRWSSKTGRRNTALAPYIRRY